MADATTALRISRPAYRDQLAYEFYIAYDKTQNDSGPPQDPQPRGPGELEVVFGQRTRLAAGLDPPGLPRA